MLSKQRAKGPGLSHGRGLLCADLARVAVPIGISTLAPARLRGLSDLCEGGVRVLCMGDGTQPAHRGRVAEVTAPEEVSPMISQSRVVAVISRFSPRRLVSLAITLVILAIPAVVAALTAAPTCGAGCLPGV
jgi:hypothetical protein